MCRIWKSPDDENDDDDDNHDHTHVQVALARSIISVENGDLATGTSLSRVYKDGREPVL
jgi:hypothetical protein